MLDKTHSEIHIAQLVMSARQRETERAATFCWESAIISEHELMFMFAICRRASVCLSSVTFVHPTQPIEIFGNFLSHVIRW